MSFFEIVMEGPGKNALGSRMFDTLDARLDEAAGRPVLLTGAGESFSAGLDLKEVASLDEPVMRRFLARLEQVMLRFYTYPGPLVALVNGHAIAGGCILTLCGDVRVAAAGERARIGLNEVALGLRFPPGIWRIVTDRVPAAALHEVALGAGLYPFERARELGLVDEVTLDARAAAERHLERLAAHPRDAYAATKRALREGADAVSRAELEAFLDASVPVWAGEDAKKRVLAVLKR